MRPQAVTLHTSASGDAFYFDAASGASWWATAADWEWRHDPDGRAFAFNVVTGDTQWGPPPAIRAPVRRGPVAPARSRRELWSHSGSGWTSDDDESGAGADADVESMSAGRSGRRQPSTAYRGPPALAPSPLMPARRPLGSLPPPAAAMSGPARTVRPRARTAAATVISESTAWSSPITLHSDRVSRISSPLVEPADTPSMSRWGHLGGAPALGRGPRHSRLDVSPPPSDSDDGGMGGWSRSRKGGARAEDGGGGAWAHDGTDGETQSVDDGVDVGEMAEPRERRRAGRVGRGGAAAAADRSPSRRDAAAAAAGAGAAGGKAASSLDAVIDAIGDSLFNLCTCSRVRDDFGDGSPGDEAPERYIRATAARGGGGASAAVLPTLPHRTTVAAAPIDVEAGERATLADGRHGEAGALSFHERRAWLAAQAREASAAVAAPVVQAATALASAAPAVPRALQAARPRWAATHVLRPSARMGVAEMAVRAAGEAATAAGAAVGDFLASAAQDVLGIGEEEDAVGLDRSDGVPSRGPLLPTSTGATLARSPEAHSATWFAAPLVALLTGHPPAGVGEGHLAASPGANTVAGGDLSDSFLTATSEAPPTAAELLTAFDGVAECREDGSAMATADADAHAAPPLCLPADLLVATEMAPTLVAADGASGCGGERKQEDEAEEDVAAFVVPSPRRAAPESGYHEECGSEEFAV